MAAYAWMVTRDHMGEPRSNVGTYGPHNASTDLVQALEKGQGEAWKTWDDDGNPAYDGRIIGEYDGFEPLDDFAGPDVGATRIAYKVRGAWRDL